MHRRTVAAAATCAHCPHPLHGAHTHCISSCIPRVLLPCRQQVALHDVDEYFQPMLKDPSKTVATFLKSRRSHLASMGAYKVQSWFFGSSEGAPVLDFHMCQLRLATYLYRAAGPVTDRRQKLLARPENVQYVSVHRITRGKPERVPNPHTDLRLVHYKLADERQYPVRDDSSMSHFAAAVQATMAPWCGH